MGGSKYGEGGERERKECERVRRRRGRGEGGREMCFRKVGYKGAI